MTRQFMRGLREAAVAVRVGGVIAYPTEAVFGLGCDPLDADAVMRVVELKRRASDKGLIVITASVGQLGGLVAPSALQRLHTNTSGVDARRATTFVVPAGPYASPLLCGGRDTIAVRVCTHPIARTLCHYVGGPLVSTSANLSGRQPARSAVQARRWFGREVDCVVGGRVGNDPRPSRIIDLISGEVLRT